MRALPTKDYALVENIFKRYKRESEKNLELAGFLFDYMIYLTPKYYLPKKYFQRILVFAYKHYEEVYLELGDRDLRLSWAACANEYKLTEREIRMVVEISQDFLISNDFLHRYPNALKITFKKSQSAIDYTDFPTKYFTKKHVQIIEAHWDTWDPEALSELYAVGKMREDFFLKFLDKLTELEQHINVNDLVQRQKLTKKVYIKLLQKIKDYPDFSRCLEYIPVTSVPIVYRPFHLSLRCGIKVKEFNKLLSKKFTELLPFLTVSNDCLRETAKDFSKNLR